jgi:hypothetical protein
VRRLRERAFRQAFAIAVVVWLVVGILITLSTAMAFGLWLVATSESNHVVVQLLPFIVFGMVLSWRVVELDIVPILKKKL